MTKILLYSLLFAAVLIICCVNCASREKRYDDYVLKCDDEGNLFVTKEREAGE